MGVLVWSVRMLIRHWGKRYPNAKSRWYETLVPRPYLFGILGPLSMLICGGFTLYYLFSKSEDTDIFVLLIIGVFSCVFFILYGTRWILIYSDDKIRYQPIFGAMRTYSFSEIKTMKPILFDLLIRVGRRWILVDAQQNWHPLWEKYHFWQKRNGIPVSTKSRVYKTAIGRAFGGILGGWGIFAVYTIILLGDFILFASLAWMCIIDGELGLSIAFLLFSLFGLVSYILILFAAAKWEKYPRFSKKMLGSNLYNAIKAAQQNKNE